MRGFNRMASKSDMSKLAAVSTSAVCAMIGTCVNLGLFFTSAESCMPFISGIHMSDRIRSTVKGYNKNACEIVGLHRQKSRQNKH